MMYSKAAEKQHRLCWCHRTVQGETVNVYRQANGEGARLSGVGTCGSVWSCPVCSPKITEARRVELMQGMVKAKALGLKAWLMTLTFPHGSDQALADLLPAFQKALASFKNSKVFKAISAQTERAGSIRSLEITWGEESGWHPHTHDLVYSKGNLASLLDHRVRPDDPQSTLRVQWFLSLRKTGLATDSQRLDVLEHGIDIRDGTYAAEYVAKYGREAESEGWGLSGELTKSHAKQGLRGGRFTPMQLLAWAVEGDERASAKWIEFSWAFLGKRMLSYSPGLKKRLDVIELPDELLASMDRPMPDEVHVGALSIDDYHEVVRRNAWGDLIEYAARYLTDSDTSQADLDDWIAWLKDQPASMGGALRKRRNFGGTGLQELYGVA